MVIDGATGRILADKYTIKGTAKRQSGEVASAIAHKGFFAVRFSADCFLPGGRQDGHLRAFPGTSAPVSVAFKLSPGNRAQGQQRGYLRPVRGSKPVSAEYRLTTPKRLQRSHP